MNLPELHVIVIGAAIGGAATAILFARAGARVTLVERVATPGAIGAGIGLAENGLAVLEGMGLGPALAHVACSVGAPRIVDGHGRSLLRIAGPTPRIAMVRRSDLYELLLAAVTAEPRITTHFGAELVASRADGTVDIRTQSGPLTLTADLVVGADGVHSRVRACGDHGMRVRKPGITYLRALVDGSHVEPLGEEAWTAAGLFGSFAVRDGVYLYASAGSALVRTAIADRDLDALRAAWQRAYPASADLLARIRSFDDLIINQVQRVTCKRWFEGRQVLVGDAAHAMAPNLGQGANSALVDAAVLLDELRRADDLTSGLARYQQRREPAVAKVARASSQLGALAEVTNLAMRWMRDRLVLPVVTRLAGPTPTATVFQEAPEALLAIGRCAS